MSNRHTVYVEGQLWHAFRIASLQRHTNASAEISAFVEARMKEWKQPIGRTAKPAATQQKGGKT
jgi:hypothetical protein